jgi:hypothetical protein
MRALTVKLILAVTLLTFPYSMRCGARAAVIPPGTSTGSSVQLAWNASADPTVTGFFVCWGTSSGVYTASNGYPASQTSAEIGDLQTNTAYYFNLAPTNANGMIGAYAGEIEFTTGTASTNTPPTNTPATNTPATNSLTVFGASTNGPPVPGGGSMPTTTSGNGGGSNITTTASTIPSNSAAIFWGVPPFLTMMMSNGQPNLNLGGTVGATVMIQGTTNVFSPDSWETMTNVALTNIAAVAQSNQSAQAQDALDLAFVPALQSCQLDLSNSSPCQYFRVVMPYDYVILAGSVLTGQGYAPRLILVNMPGIISDDACYVTEGSSFIHYDRSTYVLQLEGSGPTIRSIANTLASSLRLDWTSASEFTYSNGLAQILATVVETEPPSVDPVPGKKPPKPSTAIDF